MIDERVAGTDRDDATKRPPRLTFRSRVTIALLVAAIVPLAGFGLVVLVFDTVLGRDRADATFAQILLFALAIVLAFAILAAFALATELMAPLRSIAAAVDRVSKGDLSNPIQVAGGDDLARLADSHNRLATDLERRNNELRRILASIDEVSPRDDVEALVERTGADASSAFDLIDATVVMGHLSGVGDDEVVPGVSRPLRALMRAGGRDIGVLIGRLPATRSWEPADQDLLELFANQMAAAIRNAELFAQVETQNRQLLELNAAKDDFLRGVSHNLQTPLTSIRAYAEQLDAAAPDRRLGIIAEQSDRLSRMVRQLLTVTRLESGALKPRSDVVSLAIRVRKAWEALGVAKVTFEVEDRAGGWLAVADSDHLDQVLWALLDNAIKYGAGTGVQADIAVDDVERRIRLTISDGGPGIAEADRDRMFTRFERGGDAAPDGGSGLGLYVSRELCRAMDGDLLLEPATADRGAAFTIVLPGEPADEG